MSELGGLRHLLATSRWDKLAAFTIAATLLLIVIVIFGEDIADHIDAIENWVTDLGPWGILAFVGVYTLATSMMIPESVLSIMAGALFGLAWGFAAVAVGGLLAALLQFTLSHYLLRQRIQRIVASRPSLAIVQRAVGRNELVLQSLIRLTPVNPATVSYVLGAAGVKLTGFLIACFAQAPHMLIEVYFGFAGKHVARLASGGVESRRLHDFTLLGGLAITIVVVVLVSHVARKALMQAVAETSDSPSAPR